MRRLPRPPFDHARSVSIVLPSDPVGLEDDERAVIQDLPAQLASEASDLARELGAPVRFVDAPPEEGPTWLIGPAANNPHLAALGRPAVDKPTHDLDRDRGLLITDAADVDGILASFSALRSLSRLERGPLVVDHAHTVEEAVARVLVEVHDTWPSFGLRGVDWTALSRRHVWSVLGATNPVVAMQRWLAELGDFHTWVRPARTHGVLPYGACVVGGEVVLTHVAEWTAAWSHGVRPGWRLVGEAVRETWASTPAAAHVKPLLVARRILSGSFGEVRDLEARGPGARWARWSEAWEPPTGAPVDWERLPEGVGYLWIGAWVPGLGVEEAIDEAFEAMADCPALIVDLRGNGGGRLKMARAFRDRFLNEPRHLGWLRTSQPGGGLGAPESIDGAPSDKPRWTKPVRFLTSPLTYSASEDAILGLQGLEHVQVWGEPTGGGSGRLRRLKLLPGWRLTISSALTHERSGRCIEGAGLLPDRLIAPDRGHPDGSDWVLDAARASW